MISIIDGFIHCSLSNKPTRTCLHWACKRNHKHIVSFLLGCGADKEILTAKDELASQLTSKPEIKRLLGGKVHILFLSHHARSLSLLLACDISVPCTGYNMFMVEYLQLFVVLTETKAGSKGLILYFFIHIITAVEVDEVPEVKEPELPIIPNYLANPPFMYSKMDNKSELIQAQHPTQNGSGEHDDDTHSDSASLSPTHEPQKSQSLLSEGPTPPPNPTPHSHVQAGEFIPVTEQNGASPSLNPSHNHTVNCTVPMDLSVEPHLVNHADYPHAVAHNGTMCSPPLASPSPSLASSSGSQVQAPVAGANPTMSRQQSISQQLSYGQAGGPMPAFQPFFFTSTFPVNVQGEEVIVCFIMSDLLSTHGNVYKLHSTSSNGL